MDIVFPKEITVSPATKHGVGRKLSPKFRTGLGDDPRKPADTFDFLAFGGQGGRVECVFGRLSFLGLDEIIPSLLVNEKKSGQVGGSFADPVLGKVKNVHPVESDGRKKGQVVLNREILRRSVTLLVAPDGVFPNPDKFFLKIEVHATMQDVADRDGSKSL